MIRFSIYILMLFLLLGCSQDKVVFVEPRKEISSLTDKAKKLVENSENDWSFNEGINNYERSDEIVVEKKKPIEKLPNFYRNDFKTLKTDKNEEVKKQIIVEGNSVKVNVESIPLNEFVNFIFSSVLKENYTVDKSIKKLQQPITLNMSQPLPKQQVFNVVEKILKDESIVMNKENGTIFLKVVADKIVKNDLSDRYIIFGRELPRNLKDNQKVIMFVPYYYLAPRETYRILDNLGVSNVKFRYINNNIQILDGEASNVRQTLQMINVIDKPSMMTKTPYLLQFENIEVQKFKQRIETILKNNAVSLANSIHDVGVVLNPIDELNALMVISPKKSWLDMILYWKDKLDVIPEVSDKPQLYMYKVKNRKADEFSQILNALLQNNNTSQLIQNKEQNTTQANQPRNFSSSSTQIKADLHTNSLMMYLTSAEYKQILPVIKKLDKLPLQVLIEVTLAEVDITNNFNLGFEWTLLNNKASLGNTATTIAGSQTVALGGSGAAYTLFKNNLTSAINAFAEDKTLDILSRPSLVILNNKTGSINVGQQIPVINSEVSTGDLGGLTPSILRNVTYNNTGITLNLTPTINSNGTLTLDISVTLSEAQANSTSNIDSPLIINRQVDTSIVMNSNDSVLLGGLISHNLSNGNTGVPILKDLPYLGELFKSQSQAHTKTELIILLKPKILDNRTKLKEESQRYRLIMKNLKNI